MSISTHLARQHGINPTAGFCTATHRQRGGTLIGLIVGLLIGLGVALGVALYVGNVPVPFVDKLPQRTADQDAAETERNKNWNPNAPLAGKAGVPATTASAPQNAASAADAAPAANGAGGAAASTGAAAGATASPNAPANTPAAARTPDPRPEVTGLFIQAGAFSKVEDAEQQRAKLAMLGFSARISERDQGGRLVYRVRVGPYETRDETQGPMDRLQAAGIEVSLVRVERSATP
jgi:cell division protein FtsN